MVMAESKPNEAGRPELAGESVDSEVRRHLFIQLSIAAALTAAVLGAMLMRHPADLSSWQGISAAAQGLWHASVRSGYALLLRIAGAFLLASILFGAAHALWRLRGPIQPKRLTWRQFRHELLFSSIWLWSAAVTAMIGALAAQAGWLKMYTDFNAYGAGYFALSLLIMLVLYDGYFYAVHRALHWGPLWKYVHSVHHITTNPNPLTQFQLSPIEQLATIAFIIGLGTVLPLHPMAWVVFSFLAIARSAIGHSNVEFFPKAMTDSRYFSWIAAGTHHNLHHRDYIVNYAVFFTVWDRLFGTLHPQYDQILRDLPSFVRRKAATA
jgi:sterol desaturase/sphingolipid hydroxylase (fatty acid hydroxylase superfamily)